MENKNLVLDASLGESVYTIFDQAKEWAIESGGTVEFDFNGVKCIVDQYSNGDFFKRYFHDSFKTGWKKIGPVYLEEYEVNTVIELELAKKANAEKEKQQRAERKKKDDEQRETFEAKTKGTSLRIIDQPFWDDMKAKNSDPYGAAIFEYAESWGKLMQVELSKQKSVKDCASETSCELGYLGITGYMYGAAVGVLSKCWKHGEELRKWHNKDYGHEGEGVVNPAILNIS